MSKTDNTVEKFWLNNQIERENMLRELWELEEYHLFRDLIMIARKDFYSRHDTMTDEEITLKYQQVIGGF